MVSTKKQLESKKSTSMNLIDNVCFKRKILAEIARLTTSVFPFPTKHKTHKCAVSRKKKKEVKKTPPGGPPVSCWWSLSDVPAALFITPRSLLGTSALSCPVLSCADVPGHACCGSRGGRAGSSWVTCCGSRGGRAGSSWVACCATKRRVNVLFVN